METAKQAKKKEYNENYKRKILLDIENLSKKSNEKVEKVKEIVKEIVEPKTDIQKLIDERLSFFFRNNQPPQVAAHPPISTVQTMKTKMVETMAVASLTLIPILCRLVFSKIYPPQSQAPQQEPQHVSINTQHMPNF